MATNEQIAKLPAWARMHINGLVGDAEPNRTEFTRLQMEITRLRKQNGLLQARVDAMVEMFKCAAKGENEIAQAVQRIVEDFLDNTED
jgi:hypothetical protein